MNKKTIAILPSHPSQFWTMYAASLELEKFANIIWVMRNKDVTVSLANHLGLEHIIISQASKGLIGNLWEMFLNIFRCVTLARKHKIDLWLTQYGSGNMTARLTGAKSICFNDDDIDNAPIATLATYPFCHLITTPDCVRVGWFAYKRKSYNSSHELFFLHPKRFKVDTSIRKELGIKENQKFCIIRLVSLTSNHDSLIRGASKDLVKKVIDIAKEKTIQVFITSEKKMDPELEPYKISIKPHRIHHALAEAEFFVGDSQSMTSEAAVLGTPALRINDFVGKISVIQRWEDMGLAFGFKPEQEDVLLKKLDEILSMQDYKEHFMYKRDEMIKELIDPVPWFVNEVKSILELN